MTAIVAGIKGGFAAVGDGWAVVGESVDEVRDRYREAEERHRVIDARPDPHPDPIVQPRLSWQSPTDAQA
jgi:hypothetical protein